jgi:aspartate aminotransferase
VLIPTPCWFCYPDQVTMAGGVPVLLPTRHEDGFQPEVEQLRAAVTDRTRMVILNTPGNPTGAVFSRETLRAIGELACERDLLVVADEVYEAILFDDAAHVSLASLRDEIAARTITVNSVSKTHAMTGWRIGYAAMPLELAERVTLLQSNSTSGPAAPSQRAALAALTGDQSHVAAMTASYAQRRGYLLERLATMPELTCVPPQGTFYLFLDVSALLGKRIGGHVLSDVHQLTQSLLEDAGVKVTSGRSFGSERHVRLSFAAAQADLELGMDRLAEWLPGR